MSSARQRSSSGFSLLDAVAAIAVLGGGLLALTSASITLTRDEKHADWTNAGHGLVQQKLEDLRGLQLGAPQVNPGTYSDGTTLKADGTANGPFTRNWTVSANDVPASGLKTVTVSVTWYDSLSGAHAHTT